MSKTYYHSRCGITMKLNLKKKKSVKIFNKFVMCQSQLIHSFKRV